MEKLHDSLSDVYQDNLIIRLVKDFFNPRESWGRQNRNQLFVGLICAAGYFSVNVILKTYHPDWNPFISSSNGLLIGVFICAGLILINSIADIFSSYHSKYPWYEKYIPAIIALLGLTTLMAVQNLNSKGALDAVLWINLIFVLIIFIIAAGHFVEGSSHEKVLKIWFALLGYYFSVVVFFYFMEKLMNV